MSDAVIRVKGLSKEYRIGAARKPYRMLRESLTDALRLPFRRPGGNGAAINGNGESTTFWALKDVSFEIAPGEVVGIVGRNGAGKSTLLKILSRITEPTTGEIEINGRIGSLLEVGTGFHPELTGRENVFLNGAILGMKRAAITKRFDEIVAFAGTEKFLDTPVKFYSSGMYMRLAFAVAAHLEPEILVVDEVLAVGDIEFQKKCMGKMKDVAGQGRTVLFVSHNLPAVRNLCLTGILLESGRVRQIGPAPEVIDRFVKGVESTIVTTSLALRTDRTGSGKIRLIDFFVEDEERNRVQTVASGMNIDLVFTLQCDDLATSRQFDIGFSFHKPDGEILTVLYSSYNASFYQPTGKIGTFRCRISRLPLNAGRYRIGARVMLGVEECDWPRDGISFLDVELGDFYGTGSRGFEGNTPSLVTPFLISGEWSP